MRIYRLGNMLGDVKRLIELLKTFLLASLFRDLLASAHLAVNAVPGQPLRTCLLGCQICLKQTSSNRRLPKYRFSTFKIASVVAQGGRSDRSGAVASTVLPLRV